MGMALIAGEGYTQHAEQKKGKEQGFSQGILYHGTPFYPYQETCQEEHKEKGNAQIKSSAQVKIVSRLSRQRKPANPEQNYPEEYKDKRKPFNNPPCPGDEFHDPLGI
jgi:hypothetical protein